MTLGYRFRSVDDSSARKFYNFTLLAGATVMGLTVLYSVREEFKIKDTAHQYVVIRHEEDLNNNGIPENFYTIDDKVALIEIDGKPVMNFLRK